MLCPLCVVKSSSSIFSGSLVCSWLVVISFWMKLAERPALVNGWPTWGPSPLPLLVLVSVAFVGCSTGLSSDWK